MRRDRRRIIWIAVLNISDHAQQRVAQRCGLSVDDVQAMLVGQAGLRAEVDTQGKAMVMVDDICFVLGLDHAEDTFWLITAFRG